MSFLILSLLCILVAALLVLRDILLADRYLERLEHVPPLDAAEPPLVSVIIPALNEEREIETALTSVLSLDYPKLEIVVLNDRSTDATPAILDRMAARHPRLRVIHIKELPAGWLGKNHALHVGARQAGGEFLLFTDADVHMAPDTLSRAASRMIEHELDHICLLPSMTAPGSLLSMLIADSLSGLISLFRPWLISRPGSRYFLGGGAFNLVRRSAYPGFGGHRPIRLCPVDDILLGRLAKESNGRCECLNGRRFVSVSWYRSVGEMVRGMRKNSFALLDYRLDLLAAATLVIICGNILPLWGLLLLDGAARLLCGGIVAISCLTMALAVRAFGAPPASLLWFPVTPYIKLYIFWQAVLFTLMQGGIDWRGTFYPLEELKRHKVSIFAWVRLKKRPEDLP
jgi:glycosyltransferase involved in cell wall biosynthesis